MSATKCALLMAAGLLASTPLTASALTYDIYLYQPFEIAEKGIRATIRETKSGTLDCTLTFEKGCIGSCRVTSVDLSSSTEHASIDLELRTRERDESLTCRFTISRDLVLYGHVTIGVADSIPGGTFYHVSFVDFVDFGAPLPPALQRRQSRIAEMELQKKMGLYENSPPARGQGGDVRELWKTKTPITPYDTPSK